MSATGKKITLLAVAVVLTLGLGELVLRAINYGAITPEMNFGINTKMSLDQGSFLPDRDLFWKLPVHPLDVKFRAVQPNVEVPPKGGRRRILVMGDSCSRISATIPPYSVLLEDSLRGHDVEVWNAAVPGYTTFFKKCPTRPRCERPWNSIGKISGPSWMNSKQAVHG